MDANRSDLAVVSDYELDGYDFTSLWSGQLADDLRGLRFDISEGAPPDLMGNPLSWLITSDRLTEVIKSHIGDGVQILSTAIAVDGKDGTTKKYYVCNPRQVLDAILAPDRAKDNVSVFDLKLNRATLSHSGQLFRLQYQPTLIVVGAQLLNDILDSCSEGIDYHPLVVA